MCTMTNMFSVNIAWVEHRVWRQLHNQTFVKMNKLTRNLESI